jgi:hypothetical protein
MRAGVETGTAPAGSGWIFRWRGLDGPWFPKFAALAVTTIVFGVGLAFVRVQVLPPPTWSENKASIIQLPAGEESRLWRLRADEGGPFPLRFELRQSPALAPLESALLAAQRTPARPHVPQLRRLPLEESVPRVPLASRGEPVFPERRAAGTAAPADPPSPLAPVIYPLAGITAAELPEMLPPLDLPDLEISGGDWRFLIRVAQGGAVAECVSLERPDQPGTTALEQWLRSVRFPAVENRWISIGLGFNPTATDDPDAR